MALDGRSPTWQDGSVLRWSSHHRPTHSHCLPLRWQVPSPFPLSIYQIEDFICFCFCTLVSSRRMWLFDWANMILVKWARRVVISQWMPFTCTNRTTAERTPTILLSSNSRQRPRSTATFGPSVCLRPTLSSRDRARSSLVSWNHLSLIVRWWHEFYNFFRMGNDVVQWPSKRSPAGSDPTYLGIGWLPEELYSANQR